MSDDLETSLKATPAALRIAEEASIALADVPHRGEKITAGDVKKHLAGLGRGPQPAGGCPDGCTPPDGELSIWYACVECGTVNVSPGYDA